MNNTLKIAVIGGTGKSGKYLVNQLIEKGFQIKILIRNPDNLKINNRLVEEVNGNVTDYSNVNKLIEGCDAVISTLGLGIPASPPTIFSQSTINVIKAMKEHKVHRYIVTTGLNVDTPFDKKSPKTLFGTDWMKQNFPISTADKQSEFEILSKSNINWTLVRLPLIELTDKKGDIVASLEDCPGDKVGATDLGIFLIQQLFNNTFIRKSPFIASL